MSPAHLLWPAQSRPAGNLPGGHDEIDHSAPISPTSVAPRRLTEGYPSGRIKQKHPVRSTGCQNLSSRLLSCHIHTSFVTYFVYLTRHNKRDHQKMFINCCRRVIFLGLRRHGEPSCSKRARFSSPIQLFPHHPSSLPPVNWSDASRPQWRQQG